MKNSGNANMNHKIEAKLKELGANFVHFVNITNLSDKENKNYPIAILFGINLSPDYLQKVMNTPDYVQRMVNDNRDFSKDEFYLTELKTGELADEISKLLIDSGYKAYSHSDKNQIETGFFDGMYEGTPLPHKTIARMAGIGWIGKNNLLITPDFGCALCLGVVLTNASLEVTSVKSVQSECGNCNICIKVCEPKSLKGQIWNLETQRSDMLDVYKCTTCFNCLLFCPWTQNYIKNANNR
jgi:epoxyqueuosine reductase QueG